MNDYAGELHYKDKTYPVVFNLNVMEEIQKEYGELDKWGKLTDGKSGEVDARAVIFGFTKMINEGLEIEAEDNGTPFTPLTHKQVGRMITEIGLHNATEVINDTVIESTQSVEKNV